MQSVLSSAEFWCLSVKIILPMEIFEKFQRKILPLKVFDYAIGIKNFDISLSGLKKIIWPIEIFKNSQKNLAPSNFWLCYSTKQIEELFVY